MFKSDLDFNEEFEASKLFKTISISNGKVFIF
jgi:hypothetical protein